MDTGHDSIASFCIRTQVNSMYIVQFYAPRRLVGEIGNLSEEMDPDCKEAKPPPPLLQNEKINKQLDKLQGHFHFLSVCVCACVNIRHAPPPSSGRAGVSNRL